ncbi:MAG: tRNA 2-thiouridine(34) synthase MnmA [Defluviitaleaceae bacterium]|nr:tRNA 2-thiouridine(34) synthase MnmA [Defluviitaleaceae bacterium]
MSTKKKRVIVGMSGGVDSSVCAHILKEQGYDVVGVTMKIWQNDDMANDGGCCGLSAVNDARRVADSLSIPFYVLDFREEFKKTVIDYFIREYFKGRTPNPCIACNRHVKWEAFLEKSLGLEADFIATGHYAKIERLENGRFAIKGSFENKKDQSYALYNLTQFQLEKTLMPLGNYSKEEIRDIAKSIGLDVANKPDSQEICFIPDNDYGNFLKNNSDYEALTGDFVDINGNKIGTHNGIIYYTVGQRKGLGAFGKPMFVKNINPTKNEVMLGSDSDVFENSLICDDINMMAIGEIVGEIDVLAKTRYSQKLAKAKIKKDGERIICNFLEPQRAITPGQSAVFYDEIGNILCGGTIT